MSHLSGVDFGLDTNLFGNLDAVWLKNQPGHFICTNLDRTGVYLSQLGCEIFLMHKIEKRTG